jgi:hypothetical protein
MLRGVFPKQLTACLATICIELEDNFHAGCKHAEPSRTGTNVGLCAVSYKAFSAAASLVWIRRVNVAVKLKVLKI